MSKLTEKPSVLLTPTGKIQYIMTVVELPVVQSHSLLKVRPNSTPIMESYSVITDCIINV